MRGSSEILLRLLQCWCRHRNINASLIAWALIVLLFLLWTRVYWHTHRLLEFCLWLLHKREYLMCFSWWAWVVFSVSCVRSCSSLHHSLCWVTLTCSPLFSFLPESNCYYELLAHFLLSHQLFVWCHLLCFSSQHVLMLFLHILHLQFSKWLFYHLCFQPCFQHKGRWYLTIPLFQRETCQRLLLRLYMKFTHSWSTEDEAQQIYRADLSAVIYSCTKISN